MVVEGVLVLVSLAEEELVELDVESDVPDPESLEELESTLVEPSDEELSEEPAESLLELLDFEDDLLEDLASFL